MATDGTVTDGPVRGARRTSAAFRSSTCPHANAATVAWSHSGQLIGSSAGRLAPDDTFALALGDTDPSGSALVGVWPGDDLQDMAARVIEVDASPAVVGVDLVGHLVPRIGPVG